MNGPVKQWAIFLLMQKRLKLIQIGFRRRKNLNTTKSMEKVGRMTTISDLPGDLVGEILSRVPLKSLRLVRSTCKTWNAWSKNKILGQKGGARMNQFLDFVIVDYRVCSLRFDLQGIQNDDDLDDPSMKQISIPNHQVEISEVYHCDGLLLCVPKDHSRRLLVWNPYLAQTRLIQPSNKFQRRSVMYALGYDNSNNNHNHKILRYCSGGKNLEVYDFSSDSWRVIDVNIDCDEQLYQIGVSVKGNTYFSREEAIESLKDYLVCFDFTRERFGQPLPLPYTVKIRSLALYSVKDEKLAVLYYLCGTLQIWITTNIEPNAVSWSSFLRLDMRLINGLPDQFLNSFQVCSFFVDEEKKVAVLIDRRIESRQYQMACIIGKDGFFKSVNIMRVCPNLWDSAKLVCSSYVPSLVQLGETKETNQPDGLKERIVKQRSIVTFIFMLIIILFCWGLF